jgi:hypothetical protein
MSNVHSAVSNIGVGCGQSFPTGLEVNQAAARGSPDDLPKTKTNISERGSGEILATASGHVKQGRLCCSPDNQ